MLRCLRRLASLNRKITMNDSLWSEVDEEAGQRMIKTNGVDLCTQAFGDPVDPGMLLIMGTTASMVRWPETLCRQLADSGLYVIRYDNRDTGAPTSYAPYAPRQLTVPAHYGCWTGCFAHARPHCGQSSTFSPPSGGRGRRTLNTKLILISAIGGARRQFAATSNARGSKR